MKPRGGTREEKQTSGLPEDRREYIRVPTECPVIFRVIEPNKSRGRNTTSNKFHISPLPVSESSERLYSHGDQSDSEIREMLLLLDWKISYLIKKSEQEKTEEIFPHKGIIVDISASGFRLITPMDLSRLMALEIEFVLPMLPFREISLIGEVLRVNKLNDDVQGVREFGLGFKKLGESQRDQIIRYVLKRQMQLQREI